MSLNPANSQSPSFRAQTADDLRELIAQAELIAANLRGGGPRAATLLYLLDAIEELMAWLAGRGMDLRPEATRLETVERQLKAKDTVLAGELARLGGLAKMREAARPPTDRWWWYVDQRVAERRRQQQRRMLLIGSGMALVLVVSFVLYRFVFPPDPHLARAMDRAGQAERALQSGDTAEALAFYRQAAEAAPEDPQWQTWVGVLEDRLGHGEAAAQAFALAEQWAGDRVRFLVTRAMVWLQVGAADRALADAQAAVAANPDSAEAYFVLGGAQEARGEQAGALAAFEKAAELAGKANNSALVVMAKTRLGMLLQAAPVMQPVATGTPVP